MVPFDFRSQQSGLPHRSILRYCPVARLVIPAKARPFRGTTSFFIRLVLTRVAGQATGEALNPSAAIPAKLKAVCLGIFSLNAFSARDPDRGSTPSSTSKLRPS